MEDDVLGRILVGVRYQMLFSESRSCLCNRVTRKVYATSGWHCRRLCPRSVPGGVEHFPKCSWPSLGPHSAEVRKSLAQWKAKFQNLDRDSSKIFSDSSDFEADEVLGYIDGPFVDSFFISLGKNPFNFAIPFQTQGR